MAANGEGIKSKVIAMCYEYEIPRTRIEILQGRVKSLVLASQWLVLCFCGHNFV